jgi:hypothetical protein
VREDGLHVAEFLLQRCQHLLAHLELDSAGVMLDGQGILTEILDEHLILPLVLALAHLEDHVLVALRLFVLLSWWRLLRLRLRCP